MKNRSRYEVIAAILKSVNKEETRTKIMYKAMLSNDQCKLYLDSLIKSGLVHEVSNGEKILYRITPKGSRFLAYYDQMKELLPVGIEENLADEYYHLSTSSPDHTTGFKLISECLSNTRENKLD